MADEIQISAKLYAAKGASLSPVAYLGSETTTATLDMAGTHMGSGTQAIGTGSDEALDLPSDISGNRWLLIKSLEAEGGHYIELGTATGGSFSGSIFGRVPAAGVVLLYVTGTIYAKADTASVNIEWKACQA